MQGNPHMPQSTEQSRGVVTPPKPMGTLWIRCSEWLWQANLQVAKTVFCSHADSPDKCRHVEGTQFLLPAVGCIEAEGWSSLVPAHAAAWSKGTRTWKRGSTLWPCLFHLPAHILPRRLPPTPRALMHWSTSTRERRRGCFAHRTDAIRTAEGYWCKWLPFALDYSSREYNNRCCVI
jgi:hypothetical protein